MNKLLFICVIVSGCVSNANPTVECWRRVKTTELPDGKKVHLKVSCEDAVKYYRDSGSD